MKKFPYYQVKKQQNHTKGQQNKKEKYFVRKTLFSEQNIHSKSRHNKRPYDIRIILEVFLSEANLAGHADIEIPAFH